MTSSLHIQIHIQRPSSPSLQTAPSIHQQYHLADCNKHIQPQDRKDRKMKEAERDKTWMEEDVGEEQLTGEREMRGRVERKEGELGTERRDG